MTYPTSIPLGRTKLFVAVAASFLFVGGGWWLFNLSEVEILSHRRFNSLASVTFVHTIGLSAFVMAGALMPWLIKKLFDKTPGLQFLEEGLVENTNMFSVGFIAWEDITGLQVRQIQSQKLIYILLRDPEKYISRCGAIKRVLLRYSLKLGTSPVTITSNSLRMNFTQVLDLVKRNLSRHSNV